MRVKMLIEFDYNPDTNEYIPISQEVVEEGAKKAAKKSVLKDDGSTEPKVFLEENKLVFNSKALELLEAQWEDKITIKYQTQGDLIIPIIGKDDFFGTKGGNKLTKSGTVACRGKGNEELAKHGQSFTLTPTSETGIFVMQGEEQVKAEVRKVKDSKIKVVEEIDPEVLPMEAVLDADGDVEITEEFTFEL